VVSLIVLVEARGFEPLSEDNEIQASMGIVTVLMSPEVVASNKWLESDT